MSAAMSNNGPPCQRGETMGTTSTSDHVFLEGTEWVFDDIDLISNAPAYAQTRTHQRCRCRLVRNSAAIALLPKRVVKFKKTGILGNQVDGYATLTSEDFAGVVDEYLPAAGVAVNDLFWIVINGPSIVLTDIASLGSNTIAIGDRLVGLTAATSGATTAGHIAKQDLTGATDVLAGQAQNAIGRAMSAATTGQTNAGILMHVRDW